jgi:hypothetical protein
MKLLLRSLLNVLSFVVTAFVVLVFLVGDWIAVYGADVWMRVVWLVLLSSTQTFLAATWKKPDRLKRLVGWVRLTGVGFTGVVLALAGVVGLAYSYVWGLYAGPFAAVVLAGLILLTEGLWMLYWVSRHRAPIMDAEAAPKTG